MKKNMLPVIAALIIAVLVIPIFGVSVSYAATPITSGIGSIVTIPEDDLMRNTGVMVLGLGPAPTVLLTGAENWFSDPTCTARLTTTVEVGVELNDEPYVGEIEPVVYYQQFGAGAVCTPHYFMPDWPADKGYQPGWDLLSQHKVLATLNGVPATPDYILCEVVEKEKAKVPPMTTKTPSKRQFLDEVIKTTLQDVSDNFVCKFHWIKPGVGALDVYFVGPRVHDFVADHMVILTVGWRVGRTTIWASELQDICILAWSMGHNAMFLGLYWNPGVSATWPYPEGYWSWDDALGPFVSCDEAAAWQLTWIHGGWPWIEN